MADTSDDMRAEAIRKALTDSSELGDLTVAQVQKIESKVLAALDGVKPQIEVASLNWKKPAEGEKASPAQ